MGTEVNRRGLRSQRNEVAHLASGDPGEWMRTTWKSAKAKSGKQNSTSARGRFLSGDIRGAVSRLARILRQVIGIISIDGAVRDGTDSGQVKGRQS